MGKRSGAADQCPENAISKCRWKGRYSGRITTIIQDIYRTISPLKKAFNRLLKGNKKGVNWSFMLQLNIPKKKADFGNGITYWGNNWGNEWDNKTWNYPPLNNPL